MTYQEKLIKNIKEQLARLAMDDNIFEKGWDGYGANPISGESIKMMEEQLKQFTSKIPFPEVLVEPSGFISLEWCGENGSFILAFNNIKKQKEYSIVNKKTSYSDFGIIDDTEEIENYVRQIL